MDALEKAITKITNFETHIARATVILRKSMTFNFEKEIEADTTIFGFFTKEGVSAWRKKLQKKLLFCHPILQELSVFIPALLLLVFKKEGVVFGFPMDFHEKKVVREARNVIFYPVEYKNDNLDPEVAVAVCETLLELLHETGAAPTPVIFIRNFERKLRVREKESGMFI